MESEAGLAGLDQEVLDRQAGAGGAVDDLHRARTRGRASRGTRCFTAATRSKYAVPGSSGSMPPCMQTSVAPSSHASCGPVGDLVEGERVGVGVGAPLGERAEPAADVADVGEVDVAVDDVGDLVADGLPAQVVGQPAHLLQQRRPRRSSASARARRTGCRGPSRPPRSAASPVGGRSSTARPGAVVRDYPVGGRPGTRVPVAVDVVEVRPAVVGAALGVDGGVQVGAARPTAKPPSGSCHGSPVGRTPGLRQPVRRVASAATWPEIRGSSHGSPARRTPGARSAAARSSKPHSAVIDAQPLQRGPGPLGVHVVGRQRRDAAPVVDAGARAAARHSVEVDQVRRRLHPRLRAEHAAG